MTEPATGIASSYLSELLRIDQRATGRPAERSDPVQRARADLEAILSQLQLVVVGASLSHAELYLAPPQNPSYGDIVTDNIILESVRKTGECPCPFTVKEYPTWKERMYPSYRCPCGREYVPPVSVADGIESGESVRILPDVINIKKKLSTTASNLVTSFGKRELYWMVAQQAPLVNEYAEWSKPERMWMWGVDGHLVASLYHHHDTLVDVTVAKGFRGDGYGTEFVETWVATRDVENIRISGYHIAPEFVDGLECVQTPD